MGLTEELYLRSCQAHALSDISVQLEHEELDQVIHYAVGWVSLGGRRSDGHSRVPVH